MSNRILSYRGLLADGGQDTILLSTKKGEKGYRITKFEIMAHEPGAQTYENIVKVYKDEQSSVDGVIDFNQNRLLAAGYFESNSGAGSLPFYQFAIFDNEIFNQDIFVTASDVNGSQPINYYLELEVIKLDESQAMVTTLKDIRNNS